jgi:hypothetical protein
MTWRYELALPLLLPVIAILRYVPRSISKGSNGAPWIIAAGIWLAACIVFSAFVWFATRGDSYSGSGISGVLSLLPVLAIVQFVPIAVASALLFVLMRLRLPTWASILTAAVGSSATIYLLPWLALVSACIFVDRSCI